MSKISSCVTSYGFDSIHFYMLTLIFFKMSQPLLRLFDSCELFICYRGLNRSQEDVFFILCVINMLYRLNKMVTILQ